MLECSHKSGPLCLFFTPIPILNKLYHKIANNYYHFCSSFFAFVKIKRSELHQADSCVTDETTCKGSKN